MNLINQCFVEHASTLIQQLNNANFTADQITRFLPLAASCISTAAENTSVYQTFANLSSRSSTAIFNEIDMGDIATQTRLNPAEVRKGFQLITPIISKAYVQHSAYQQLLAKNCVASHLTSAYTTGIR